MIIRALYRFVKRSPWSTLMAVAGVVLGVTSIVSVHLVSGAVAEQLERMVPGPIRGLDAAYTSQVTPTPASDYFALRMRWRRGELPGIGELWPVIDEHIRIGGRDVRVLGIDVFARASAVPSGEWRNDGRVTTRLSSTVWASDDLVRVLEAHPIAGAGQIEGGLQIENLILVDVGLAQEILGWAEDDLISYVAVEIENPVYEAYRWLDEVIPGASAGLPEIPPPEIRSWQARSLGELQPANRFGKAVLFNIGALGLLALVVAWFLIYQVAVAWLRRLWQIFVRLHVMGVTYTELGGYFVGLLAILGLFSGVAGLWLGAALASTLMQLGVGITTELPIDIWLVVKALGSALVVCILGGYWAYASNLMATAHPRVRNLVVVLAICGGITGVSVEATGLIGAFFAIACACVGTLAMLAPLLGGLRRMSGRLFGDLLLRMSLREVVWFPRDLWIALGGLVLAIATAIGVSLMVASFRMEFTSMLDQRLSYDFSVTANADALHSLADVARADAAVRRVQLYSEQTARVDGVVVNLSYAHLDAMETERYGFSRSLASDEALVSEQAARLLGVASGQSLDLEGRSYQVVSVFKSFGDMLPRILIDDASRPPSLEPVSLSLAVAPGASIADLQAMSGLRWQDQGTIREVALDTFDRTFAITSVLIVIAVLVAGIGIYVATTVIRLNQQASTRLLDGMGVARREVWLIDLARGLGIGGIACIVALPLGCLVGWLLCDVVNPRAFGWTVTLKLIPKAMLVPVLWGIFAATVAALVRVGLSEQGRFDAVAR